MLQYSFLTRFVRFLKENPSAWFVLAFQALLAACAVMLVFDLGSIAEGIAIVAYFALVTGVVLQLVRFLRHGSNG